MPSYRTFMRWLTDDDELRQNYAHTRATQAEFYADEIISMADSAIGGAPEIVAAVRNAVDARKWVTSKLLPKKYGDRPDEVHVNTTVNNCIISTDKLKELQDRRMKSLPVRG